MSRGYMRYILSIIFISIFCINTVLAAEFNATVESNSVKFGQSFALKLILSDATATDALDLSPLAKDFIIYQQQQYSHYANNNGVIKAEKGWQVVLMPKKEGEFIIPSLSVETNQGSLATHPIKITIEAVKPGDKSNDDTAGVSLVATISKDKGYVQEPLVYALKIISNKPLLNIVLEDLKAKDAIIEKIGEPKQYDQTLGGVRAHIIEITYAITPLQAGNIRINPALMHGEIQVQVPQSHPAHRFGIFNNIFHNPVYELKPFSMQSEAINIDVKPATIKTKNWLPLQNLTLSESFDSVDNAKVGDTITRKIKMVAKGNFASALPTIKDVMQGDGYKVYANKPITNNTLDTSGHQVIGVREEEYSIVPERPGSITLPEIKVTWWNMRSNKLETTKLPAKTIQVLPSANASTANDIIDYSGAAPELVKTTEQETQNSTQLSAKSNWVLIFTGILVGVVACIIIITGFWLLKKIKRKPKTKANKISELIIDSPIALRQAILSHAQKNWQVAPDIVLNRLGDALSANNYAYDVAAYINLSKDLNAAIYACATKNFDALIEQWQQFKTGVVKLKTISKKGEVAEDYSSLNPT